MPDHENCSEKYTYSQFQKPGLGNLRFNLVSRYTFLGLGVPRHQSVVRIIFFVLQFSPHFTSPVDLLYILRKTYMTWFCPGVFFDKIKFCSVGCCFFISFFSPLTFHLRFESVEKYEEKKKTKYNNWPLRWEYEQRPTAWKKCTMHGRGSKKLRKRSSPSYYSIFSSLSLSCVCFVHHFFSLFFFLDLEPDVTFVDGNGRLHPRGAGLACHFGVMTGLRTVGIGKTFLHVDGLSKHGVREARWKTEVLVKKQEQTATPPRVVLVRYCTRIRDSPASFFSEDVFRGSGK